MHRLTVVVRVAIFMALVGLCTPALAQEGTFKPEAKPLILGNRIPQYYFVTSGSGDTDIGPGEDPWETGSYDLALLEAHLANFNVVPYTSVLPPESKEVTLEFAKQYFHHGAVVETIIAQQNGVQGDTLVTGVGRIWVSEKATGKAIGGFAAEFRKVHKGVQISEEEAVAEAKKFLEISLNGEVSRRYDPAQVESHGMTFETNYEYVDKAYGTSLTALAWVTYIFPAYSH
jgi:pyruvoyl-dependent arginine decarboxylase (PvlArgDC)